MTDSDEAARILILARLAESREQLRRLLEPPADAADGSAAGGPQQGFPRSRTMQMLLSGRGAGILGAAAAGLFIARPSLALRLLRMLPAGAAARFFLLRTLAQLRAKHQPKVTNP
jgi:hypothetical protein